MIVAVALALLLLGVLVGARGMRRLGRSVRGPWRPGVGLLGVLAAFAALALLARGVWFEGGVLAFAAVACLYAARRRSALPPSRPPAQMSRREAAELLGVAETATAAQSEAAFRRLILKLHPDQGGTAGLSSKLQEARRVMARR